jgi:hypothetical protein
MARMIPVRLKDGTEGDMDEAQFVSEGWGAKGAMRLDGAMDAGARMPAAPSPAPPKQYGKIETFLRNALGTSAHNFGEEGAAGTGSTMPVSPFSGMPIRMPKGYEPPAYDKAYSDLVEQRRLSAAQNPKTAVMGELTGATVGSPAPGGPLLKTGAAGVKTAVKAGGRLLARGTAEGTLAAAGAAEGNIGDRAKTAAFAIPTSAAASAIPAAIGAPFARTAARNIDPLTDELSGLRPWTFANPELLRNAGGIARVASLRSSPGTLGEVAAKVSRQNPDLDPSTAIINWGRDLNSMRSLENPALPMLGRETAPALERTFLRASKASGEQIGKVEQTAAERGATASLKEAIGKVKAGPAARLETNDFRKDLSAGPFMGELMGGVEASGPKMSLVQFPPPKAKVVGNTDIPLSGGPETLFPPPGSVAPNLSVNRAPGTLRMSEVNGRGARPTAFAPPGQSLPPPPQSVSLPNRTVETLPDAVPNTRMLEMSRMARQKADDAFQSAGEHPYAATVGGSWDRTAGILNGMGRDSTRAALDPAEQALYDSLRKTHGATATGAEAVNSMKGVASAPFGISAEFSGLLGQQAAQGAGLGPIGQVSVARLARLASRVRNVNPNRAYRDTRIAEALEGAPLNLKWGTAAAGLRGMQALPDRLIRGAGIMAGDEVADVVEDPTRAGLDFNDVRAKALRRFLLGE